jgi:2-oxoglutarate dehydrogenase E2 component (dihydrolipoamide succinyltransferase)
MRILLILAMAGLAACSTAPTESVSDQPAAAPAPAAAAAPAPAAAPSAPASPAAAAAPAAQEEAEWRPPAGYKARVENGNRVYCRKTTVLGSRFAKDVCMTEAQLRDFEQSNEGMRQNKDQTSRMCAGGGACQAQ